MRGDPYFTSKRHADGLEYLLKSGFGFFRSAKPGRIAGINNNAMSKDGNYEPLYIVRYDEIAAADVSKRLGPVIESEAAARADSQVEYFRFSSRANYANQIIDERVLDYYLSHLPLEGQNFVAVHNRLNVLDSGGQRLPPQNVFLIFRVGVSHSQPHQEPVQLGFGQRIGAVMLDRVLCGENDERLGQLVGFLFHRYVAFGHRFKQRGLSFWSGAIDLVGQNYVRENRPGFELERAQLLVEYFEPDYIGREQVGGELNPLKRAIEASSQSLGQCGLADSGDVFDQQVTAGQNACQSQFYYFRLASYDAFDG